MRLVGVSFRLYTLTTYAIAALCSGCHEGDCYGTRGDPCSDQNDCRDPYVCEDDYCRETCTVKEDDCYEGVCIPSEIAKSGGICTHDDEAINDDSDILNDAADMTSNVAGDVSQVGTDGGSNGNDQSGCFWVCDQAAINCAGLCISYLNAAIKKECDGYCAQNKDECHTRCTIGDDNVVNELIQCQAICSNSGMTCNAFCLTQLDPVAKEDCENTCIEDMKTCAAQC